MTPDCSLTDSHDIAQLSRLRVAAGLDLQLPLNKGFDVVKRHWPDSFARIKVAQCFVVPKFIKVFE
jgi:hypothetical protein